MKNEKSETSFGQEDCYDYLGKIFFFWGGGQILSKIYPCPKNESQKITLKLRKDNGGLALISFRFTFLLIAS